MITGYSGTPLDKKLGLKTGFLCSIYNAPESYLNWLKSLEFDLIYPARIRDRSLDFFHGFCTTYSDLETIITKYKSAIKMNGSFWVSWPKGSSKIPTELNRDLIRSYVLEIGLVDVKVAAIDENWSGLKFVYRLKDRTL
ncbi:MAG: DUF3052 domain-containing protein [Bacteroidia bacterium]|nr:DUF3052 domain-containing protein [Bacteroidia bacterium]NNK60538.1 DUF3052 domain-containing protein [Flavobacteriaceae bacterium]RZW56909.1 MAG: DUF3052 domain-containing protein [Flavobacteriaceae bacterium]